MGTNPSGQDHDDGQRQTPDPPRVIWSPQARADLELVVEDPAVREQLERNAEETLHEVEDRGADDHTGRELAVEEGRVGEICGTAGGRIRSRAGQGGNLNPLATGRGTTCCSTGKPRIQRNSRSWPSAAGARSPTGGNK